MSRLSVSLLTGLLGCFLFFGCTRDLQKMASHPVVQVNTWTYSMKEFSRDLAFRLKSLDALAAKDQNTLQRVKSEVIGAFVLRSLLQDWATSKDIVISEADLDDEVNQIRSGYPDDLSFRKILAQEGISLSEWREQLKFRRIEAAFFKSLNEKIQDPSAEEVAKYYQENLDSYKVRERIYLRQIVVDDEAKAETLKAELKKKDFSDMAKKYSLGPEANNGGLVGWVEKGSVDFFDPAFSIPVGTVSAIVKSAFGWHLLKAEQKKGEGTLPLADVKARIVRTLRSMREQAEFVAWMDRQLRSSKVLKDYDLINAIRVDTKEKE